MVRSLVGVIRAVGESRGIEAQALGECLHVKETLPK